MWSRLRETVAGFAEQVGIEVPGLDSGAAAVTDLTGSAGDASAGVVAEVGATDLVGTATDLAGSAAPAELLTGATDAAAGGGDALAGVVDEVRTTTTGLLEAFKGGIAP